MNQLICETSHIQVYSVSNRAIDAFTNSGNGQFIHIQKESLAASLMVEHWHHCLHNSKFVDELQEQTTAEVQAVIRHVAGVVFVFGVEMKAVFAEFGWDKKRTLKRDVFVVS